MKIISAIGSFKGSLDSIAVNETVKEVLEKKGFSVEAIPVADGGDGLLDSLCRALNGKYVEIETENAVGEPIVSKIAVTEKIGIVEMALASGLAILNEEKLNPLKASTYGTGLLIKHLANSEIKEIILGIGGSATNDGGIGCLNALGFDFYDKDGKLLSPCAESLQYVKKISDKRVSEEIRSLKIRIACDVTNPLLGKEGATYIYGPQKGVTEELLPVLERGMENYSRAVNTFCGKDYSLLEGAGAAGGLGYGLVSLLKAELRRGAEIVLDSADYSEKLKTADLVITGEGRIDNQTVFGKLPQIVATKAKEQNVRCIALAGSSVADKEVLRDMGISKVYELINYAPFERCMNDTKSVIEMALEDISEEV